LEATYATLQKELESAEAALADAILKV